ncbi:MULTISPECIES: 3-deoxy-manno-octulosonate cytidylyltransferase [unclassified Chelatococcus]|uniref:3-deoxy-manno-octulosonate cytidylyltransferase n=1 Tax=unclassified Chelatococcus TaxID=2638111 RepID=UPI001BCC59BC|nr:3-deoxy-manno-octulosonate cytidylyltransferase [Chelatococcus sp.]MBS7697977.1 3-deoxy-manno-octulosonate cytidylyltransferase [Chelatococcus sp. YT9]MBX3556705.1 3-deoxy-manno-octulosonate cytidylyltransferase [Chelatococcus sp.]
MNPIVVIPARRAATRLPGKPLADIAGEPMIVHVWRRAIEADVGPVLVATDDDEIAEAIRGVGGDPVLTRSDHPSGSDRVFEAISLRDPDQHYDVIVNIQGDLPTVARDTIRDAMAPLTDADVAIGTPVVEITIEEEKTAPSVVKMIGSPIGARRFRALYFTRATAPSGDGPLYHHIGLYVWRRAALARFIALPPSPLELREKLEQLRAIEAGMRIDAVEVDAVPLGVDTEADLERARRIFAETAGVR